jgi:uncharacterized protein
MEDVLEIYEQPYTREPNSIALVGLISDTHGLLRDEAVNALQDSDLIIHAGDIGNPEIIERLGAIAPIVAVRGNIDKAPWASALPENTVAKAGAALIYVLHNIEELDLDPATAGFHFVISGHSHKPGQTQRSGVTYINPGSAGPRRFRLPVTVARMDFRSNPCAIEFVDVAGST